LYKDSVVYWEFDMLEWLWDLIFWARNVIALNPCMSSPTCFRVSSKLHKWAYTSSRMNVAWTLCITSKALTYPSNLNFLSITLKNFLITFLLYWVSLNSLNLFLYMYKFIIHIFNSFTVLQPKILDSQM
jgi:hypothetical protein